MKNRGIHVPKASRNPNCSFGYMVFALSVYSTFYNFENSLAISLWKCHKNLTEPLLCQYAYFVYSVEKIDQYHKCFSRSSSEGIASYSTSLVSVSVIGL